jgi:hypothetical protein
VRRSLFIFLAASLCSAAADAPPSTPSPVLVELFTSEGCSSCPPADALLQRLDAAQPVPGAQIIVLSEHVDYWDHDGWVDPYSSRILTDRQSAYSTRFRLASPYTPEMVVDGQIEFVGSNLTKANLAIANTRVQQKVPIKVSGLSFENGVLRAHVETGALHEDSGKHKAEIYLVLALDHAESQVQRGENQGRRLTHVAVVTSLRKIGALEKDKSFAQDVQLKIDRQHTGSLRIIVFVQEPAEGRVLGAALQSISTTNASGSW